MTEDRNKLCVLARDMAELFFGIPELALILEYDESALRLEIDAKSDLGRAILAGWLLSEAEFRRSVIKHAKQGSTAAQTITKALIDKIDP